MPEDIIRIEFLTSELWDLTCDWKACEELGLFSKSAEIEAKCDKIREELTALIGQI